MQDQPTSLTETITFKTAGMVIHYESLIGGGFAEIFTFNSSTTNRDWQRVCDVLETLGAVIDDEPLYSPADGSDLWTVSF